MRLPTRGLHNADADPLRGLTCLFFRACGTAGAPAGGRGHRPVVVAGHGDGTVAPVVSQVLAVQVLPVPAVVK